MGLFKTIPGLQDVADRENAVRDAALIGLPDKIAGIEVRLMTLEDYIALRLIKNPFVVGGFPSAEAVFEFFKRMRVPIRGPSGWRNHRRLVKACRACRLPELPLLRTNRAMNRFRRRMQSAPRRLFEISEAIHEYIKESIQDWPAGDESTAEECSVYGPGVAFCSMLWREYRWPFEKTLRMPVKVLMQCVKEIQQRHGKKTFRSPSKDHIAAWLLTRQN